MGSQMADWKARNEVADSDDEDDEIDVAAGATRDLHELKASVIVQSDARNLKDTSVSQRRASYFSSDVPQPSSPPVIAADDSEDELTLPAPRLADSRKLSYVPLGELFSESSQVRRSTQPHLDEQLVDDAEGQDFDQLGTQLEAHAVSSPLSSLSTTPRELSPDNLTALTSEAHVTDHLLDIQDNENGNPVGERLMDDLGSYAPLRSLRRRNAVQLNPYRVEDAIYRQLSRAAGLAPIRINRHESTSAEETQDYVPPVVHGQGPEAWNGLQSDEPQSSHGDSLEQHQNLSDVFDLPLSPLAGSDWPDDGHRKRRKLNNAHQTHGGTVKDTGHILGLTIAEELALNDPLLSPPSSSNQGQRSPLPTKRTFRYPPGMTPPQLRTPAVSSEARSKRPIVLSDDAREDNSQHSQGNPQIEDLSEKTGQSGSDDDEAGEYEVQSARRRIKGVLPASWLRIDLQKHSKYPATARSTAVVSPVKTPRVGVARPVAKSKERVATSLRQRQTSFIIPEDPDSEDNDGTEPAALIGASGSIVDHEGPLQLVADADSDSMEDDRIDQMLPPTNRASHRPRKYCKSGGTDYGLFRNSGDGKQRYVQTKISVHRDRATSKTARPRRRPSKLGIGDLASSTHNSKAPNFVRIAVRTTKRRRDRGRHYPSRKILQMTTREQTAELKHTVSLWRDGALSLNDSPSPQTPSLNRSRLPLASLTGNERQSPSRPLDVKSGSAASEGSRRPSFKTKQRPRTLENVFFERLRKGDELVGSKAATRTSRASHGQRQRGTMASRLFSDRDSLPALLEAPRLKTVTRPATIVERVQPLHHRAVADYGPNGMLEQYLESNSANHADFRDDSEERLKSSAAPVQRQSLVRKRPPRRAQPSFQMTSIHNFDEVVVDEELNVESDRAVTAANLFRYEPFGIDYTPDFDVERFPSSFVLNTSAFIASGQLQEILDAQMDKEMMTSRTPILVQLPNSSGRWGPWNEQVSSQLSDVAALVDLRPRDFEHLLSDWTRQLDCILTSIILYLCQSLSFLDAIDRQDCVGHCNSLINRLRDILLANLSNSDGPAYEKAVGDNSIPLTSKLLLLAYQVSGLACNSIVDTPLRQEAQANLRAVTALAAKAVLDDGISDLVKFWQCAANCSADSSSAVAQEKVEALVILLHITDRSPIGENFWELAAKTRLFRLDHTAQNIQLYERKWFSLFAILPFFDLAANGAVDFTSCNSGTRENWGYVKRLASPFLESHTEQPRTHSYNEYCRTLFRRCYTLTSRWGWYRCEPILRSLYDFFARNNLRNLDHELPRGHPTFLEHPRLSTLVLEKRDTAYAVFLKLVGVAIIRLRELIPVKNLRSIIYRLTPNHGRSLPKDEALKEEDLEALRNHHSLLALLYLVSPALCRPALGLIRDLIRFEDSHQAACHISIRTWTDLTTSQLSTGAESSDIQALCEWFSDILGQLVQQHALARREVELHYQDQSRDVQETTIATNQRHVEAVLVDALKSLQKALGEATTTGSLSALLVPTLESVFGLFDVNVPRINSVLKEALMLIRKLITQAEKLSSGKDSQEYGDWSAFDDVMPQVAHEPRLEIPDTIQKSLRLLLSNVLGANKVTEDQLVVDLLQTWVSVAHFQVLGGTRAWSDFVDMYGKESWYGLSETDQKTKYTPLFFAMVIDQDQTAYDEHKLPFLRSWLASLADRESQIKFQGRLTSAILNRDSTDPLLENPPFARGRSSGDFMISASELAERRLTLVSCILSNMWESQQSCTIHNLPEAASQKQDYADLLKTLMRTMKDNYMALGNGRTAEGAYVEFVQNVISLMQQYTKEICAIDRFFTDSGLFPLPVHDPNYVVGRLKGYALRLDESQVQKQLTTFLLSTTERAVTDGKQEYLITQLERSMLDMSQSDKDKLTLPSFFTCVVVPACIGFALKDPCGWLLVEPLMQATTTIFGAALLSINSVDESNVSATLRNIMSVLAAMQRSLLLLVDHPGHLELASTARMLQVFYAVVCATLYPLDYCVRAQPSLSDPVLQIVHFFRGFAAYAFCYMHGNAETPAPLDDEPLENADNLAASRRYAEASLKTALSTRWTKNEDGYEVRSSTGTKAVRTDLRSFDEEREVFDRQLLAFYEAVHHLPAFGRWQTRVVKVPRMEIAAF